MCLRQAQLQRWMLPGRQVETGSCIMPLMAGHGKAAVPPADSAAFFCYLQLPGFNPVKSIMSETVLPLTLADGARLGKATLSREQTRAEFSSLSMEDLPPLDLRDLQDLKDDPALATMSLPPNFMSTCRAPLQRRRGQFRRNSDPLVLEKTDARLACLVQRFWTRWLKIFEAGQHVRCFEYLPRYVVINPM